MRVEHELAAPDLRACYALIGECRDLGFDCRAWQAHAAERTRSLLGSQVVISGNFVDFAPGRCPRPLWATRTGWPGDRERRAWEEYVTCVPWECKPEFPLLIGRSKGDVLATRDCLWGRRAWYRSAAFNEHHRAAGVDDYIMSIRRVTASPGDAPLSHSLWVHRAVGDKPFGPRETALLGFLHGEIARLIGGALAAPQEPEFSLLTARQRQVLSRLLDGDSEKQIAFTLDLARATVHEHVTALYRHFGVSSRAELMARFVGRARPVDPAPSI